MVKICKCTAHACTSESVVAGNATADFDTSLPHKGVFIYLEPSIVEELKSSKLKTLTRASSDLCLTFESSKSFINTYCSINCFSIVIEGL